uniref:Retinoblastoma 1 n=1 Tax=Pygocentrus nattereri TaxID=42514 RepID=A0AAR2LLF3_PYGNA
MPPKRRTAGTPSREQKSGSRKSSSPDTKHNSVVTPEKHEEKDPEFITLCKDLLVTNLVCDNAWATWESVAKSAEKVNGSNKPLWGACIFISAVDLEDMCFTFTELQKAVGLSLKQFFNLVRKMDENLDTISPKVNSAVTKLEKKYEVSLALYQRFYQSAHTSVLCFISLLCLLDCTGTVLQMEDDLVIAFQLLLCVLEFCTKRLRSSITLNQQYCCLFNKMHVCVRPVFSKKYCNFQYLTNVLKQACVDTFSEEYEKLYHKNKDFDARLFLVDDETPTVEITPRKNQSGEESVPIPPQTPIRAAMYSIQQLRGELTSASDQPSGNLIVYFKNCTVDPSEEITKRVEQLGQIFCQKFAEAVGQRCEGLGKERFTLGVQLYYKVMESMLKSEEKRLSVQNFSKLLNNATFHTSLLACALEVVMATYVGNSLKNGNENGNDTDLCFPWILDVFQLYAFDFYKVIESFIKAEPTLKHNMIEHLGRCEQQIMESIAWKADSPLFELLKQSREEGPGEQAEPPATLNQPLQHNHTAENNVYSVVQHTAEFRSTPYSPVFLQSMYLMAYLRLKMLFSHLLTSHPELEHIIWTLLQHTLQNEYELMKDRHLDQLMMCAMYAICKVKNVDLRFKTIVTAYKELPNTNQEIFKHVLIREGQYDSIIVFYNLVFMQKLKTNILQYSSPRPPPLSPIPHIPRSPYKYPSSPLRVPGGNVYISPLKSSRMTPSAMTPRSRILVSIGESFGTSDKFQKINQMVSSTDWSLKRRLEGDSTPKPLKRLRFDVDGQDEADGRWLPNMLNSVFCLAFSGSARSRMQEQKLKEEAEKEDPEP